MDYNYYFLYFLVIIAIKKVVIVNQNIEHREIVEINCVKLTKDDILELVDIITYNIENYHDSIRLSFQFKNKIQRFNGKEELKINFPTEFDSINFEVLDWKNIDQTSTERDIVSSISISMDNIVSHFQIFSIDENWFLGKKTKLLNFFKSKKASYDGIKYLYAFLSGLLIVVFPLLAINFFKQDNNFYSILCIIASVFVAITIKKNIDGTFMPKTKFILKDKKFDFSVIVGISTILGAIFGGILLVKELLK